MRCMPRRRLLGWDSIDSRTHPGFRPASCSSYDIQHRPAGSSFRRDSDSVLSAEPDRSSAVSPPATPGDSPGAKAGGRSGTAECSSGFDGERDFDNPSPMAASHTAANAVAARCFAGHSVCMVRFGSKTREQPACGARARARRRRAVSCGSTKSPGCLLSASSQPTMSRRSRLSGDILAIVK